MTNRGQGSELLGEATRILERDVASALKDDDYNAVVRRSQEAVELALKGALRMLGVDFPKVHDVGDVFCEQVAGKHVNMSREVGERIQDISRWLTAARAPSFYFERAFTREDAAKASADATFAVNEVRRVFGTCR